MPPSAAELDPFACPADFALQGGPGKPPLRASGLAEVDAEKLILTPSTGPPMVFPALEMLAVAAEAHAVRLRLSSGGVLILSGLGSRFDACLQALTRARHEALLDAFWMREEPAAPPFQAEQDDGDASPRPCELRLMDTALVVLYPDADPARLPYALVDAVHAENFGVTLEMRWKGRWTFRKLGRCFDPFMDALRTAMAALHTTHLDRVRRAVPGLDPAVLRGAARLLLDGIAAPTADLDAASLWGPLERAVSAAGTADALAALKAMASPEGMRAGIKRGLAGDLSGDYLFFLVPLGNGGVIALETARLEGEGPDAEGRATYLFRGDGDAGTALDALNRDLLELNFRREPLLLPDDALPRRRPAALDALRARLLGRALHRSPESWKAEVLALSRTFEKGTP